MKLAIGSIFLLMLTACGGHRSAMHDPKDPLLHKVTCSEFNTDKDTCRAKAEARCPNGIARITHYQEDYEDQGDGFIMHTKHHYTVQCKP